MKLTCFLAIDRFDLKACIIRGGVSRQHGRARRSVAAGRVASSSSQRQSRLRDRRRRGGAQAGTPQSMKIFDLDLDNAYASVGHLRLAHSKVWATPGKSTSTALSSCHIDFQNRRWFQGYRLWVIKRAPRGWMGAQAGNQALLNQYIYYIFAPLLGRGSTVIVQEKKKFKHHF